MHVYIFMYLNIDVYIYTYIDPHKPGVVGAAPGEATRTPLLAAMKAVFAGWGRSAGLPGGRYVYIFTLAPKFSFSRPSAAR